MIDMAYGETVLVELDAWRSMQASLESVHKLVHLNLKGLLTDAEFASEVTSLIESDPLKNACS